MVQFIPNAPGASPFRTNPVAQILYGMGDVGKGLGGRDENGNMTGIAALVQALRDRQTMDQRFGQGAGPAAPGPAGPVPTAGVGNVLSNSAPAPAPAAPAARPSPFGPFGGVPVNRMRQLAGIMGQNPLTQILGYQNSQTVYYDPTTGTASLTPTPNAIPISGFKGPQALAGMNQTNMNAWRQQYQTKKLDFDGRLQKLRESTSLTPAQKLKLAMVTAQSRILGNPLIDLQEDETQGMMQSLQEGLAALEKDAGLGAGAPKQSNLTPEAWLKANFPDYQPTKKNLEWAKKRMNATAAR